MVVVGEDEGGFTGELGRLRRGRVRRKDNGVPALALRCWLTMDERVVVFARASASAGAGEKRIWLA